jgi:hypothetical protein
MLYTEGNLTVEDAAMRRIARSKVRAALCSCETKTDQPQYHETQYQSKQPTLFDPRWLRDPVEGEAPQPRLLKRAAGEGRQLRLYLGPELVK